MTKLKQPYKDLLPALSSEEYAALKADIKRHGVLHPIVVDEDGNILDGHHRYSIDKNAPQRVVTGLSEAERESFVFRSNFARRNLSPAQANEAREKMREVAVRLKKEKQTQQTIAALLGVCHKTVANWVISNCKDTNADNVDCRVKLTKDGAKRAIELRDQGWTQQAIADELKVSQPTINATLKKEEQRQELEAAIEEAAQTPKTTLHVGPYDVILADPPWRYDFSETDSRKIENQYPTATIDEICGHIPDAANDAVLFMWATAPKLEESFSVMRAWGFTYTTCAVWDKEVIGMGYWFRSQHELLLVGIKGRPNTPHESKRVGSIFTEKRGKHSKKPLCVYEWIERTFPGKKLEMYCRTPRPGWAVWGNQV